MFSNCPHCGTKAGLRPNYGDEPSCYACGYEHVEAVPVVAGLGAVSGYVGYKVRRINLNDYSD